MLYDKDGDAHYDTISAFIKSVRGSDPDAALYWMAKMLYAGEDPRFIFRRMLILACEDVGMADPAALGVVVTARGHSITSACPKAGTILPMPVFTLRPRPRAIRAWRFSMRSNRLRRGQGRRPGPSARRKPGQRRVRPWRRLFVSARLPRPLGRPAVSSRGAPGKDFYQPSDQGHEKSIRERVARKREAQIEAMIDEDDSTPLSASADKNGPAAATHWLERTLGSRRSSSP